MKTSGVRRKGQQGRARKPLVSVITVCRNAATTVERTVRSVLAQSYKPLEYIIVDGGSTDGTLDIIRRNRRKIARIVSEPDRGISDAFNKGIRLSRGAYVHLLNADDWMEPDTISRGVEALELMSDRSFAYGDLVEENPHTGHIHVLHGDPRYGRWIRYVMGPLNHPTVLVRKSLYDRYGAFDERWSIAMDYDFLLRVHRAGEKGLYVPGLRVHMTTGGFATREALRSFKEVRDISIRHGFPAWLAFGYQGLRILKQFIYRLVGLR